MFMIFGFVFVSVASLVQAVTSSFPLDSLDYPQSQITRHLLVLAIGIVSFEIGRAVALRVAVRSRHLRDHPPSQEVLGLSPGRLLAMGTVGTLFVAYQVAKHGALAFFVSRDQTSALLSGYTEDSPLYLSPDKTAGLLATFLAQFFVFVALYLILYARRNGMWRPDVLIGLWGWRFAVTVFAAANLVMNNPLGNGRWWFCLIAVCFTSIYVPVRGARNILLYTGAAIAILLLAFSFLDYFRVTDRAANERVERGLASASYPVLQSGLNGERYIDQHGHTYGRQLTGAVLGFVPRRVWPEKANDTGQVIDPQYARSASAWTEMQLDFGIAGVVSLFFVWGAGAVAADRRLLHPEPGVVPAFLVLLATYQLFLLRGSFLSAFGSLYELLFLVLCGTTIARRRSSASPMVDGPTKP